MIAQPTLRRRAALAFPLGLPILLPIGLGLAGQLLRPLVALAHVNLLETDPPTDMGRLETLPAQVVLRFSGPIEPGPKARLLAADGTPVSGVTAARDPDAFSQLVIGLPPGQAQGAYTALWDVVSLEDGHEQNGFVGLLAGRASLDVSLPMLVPPAAAPADLDVLLTAVPDARGLVQWVTSVGGPTAPAVTRIQYRFAPPIADRTPLQANGEWSDSFGGYTYGQPIALAGEWKAEVVVRRDGFPDDLRLPFVCTVALPVPAPAI